MRQVFGLGRDVYRKLKCLKETAFEDLPLEIYTHFKEPLKTAGFKGNVGELLEQRDAIIEYAVNNLNPSRTSNWYKLFNSLINRNWSLPCPSCRASFYFTRLISC